MPDEKGPDAKVLTVPSTDPRWAKIADIADSRPYLLDEIAHLFGVYKALEPEEGSRGQPLAGRSEPPASSAGSSGIWAWGRRPRARYKFEILTDPSQLAFKTDPVALAAQKPPATDSIVTESAHD